ncbi:unnamed protein product [Alopecurus aequalis]
MAGGDRLSDLPNDLLRRVLHFVPAREGASTSALSKRWRGLWRSSGAMNLDAHVPEGVNILDLFSQRDALVSAARLALEAAGSPLTRLTFRVDAGGHDRVRDFLYRYYDLNWRSRSPDVVTELLSLPAARRVEELRLAPGNSVDLDRDDREYTGWSTTGFGDLSFLCLLSDTLRVLDVTGCADIKPSPAIAFPQLASLRLSLCVVTIEHLHDFIDAAPALTTVYLESVRLDVDGRCPTPDVVRLNFPGVTELLLDSCSWPREWLAWGTTAVEIDGPRLRRFTYKGLLRPLSLTSPTPDLTRVDLHIFRDVYERNKDARRDLETFWRCAQNFSNAKELKLRMNQLEDIAVVGSANRAKLLCSFHNLERLQLDASHRIQGKTAAVAVANLLSCCPILRDIRINLTMVQPDSNKRAEEGRCFLEEKYRRDFEKSIHGFRNRRLASMVSVEGDYDDGNATYDKLSDLPALSRQDFKCLQSSLCCVRLQFCPETNIFGEKLRSNFGAQLIKFFAENAVLLKEMHIYGGNGKMCKHINHKLERWLTTNSSEKRKTTLVILPLEVKS